MQQLNSVSKIMQSLTIKKQAFYMNFDVSAVSV